MIEFKSGAELKMSHHLHTIFRAFVQFFQQLWLMKFHLEIVHKVSLLSPLAFHFEKRNIIWAQLQQALRLQRLMTALILACE